MTRWLLIALAVSACAKGKDSAPATGNAPADQSTPSLPPPPPPPVASDPEAARTQATEETRNHGGLGVSAKTDAFDPIGEYSAKGGEPKERVTADRRRVDSNTKAVSPGSSGGGPKVGGSDGTRGDADKVNYRALITGVKLDGKPAPAALSTAIRANLAKVQACYDKTLASSTALVGELAITFTVLPTGVLSAGAVGTSTVKQDALEACVIAALAATKLAASPGKTAAKAEVTIMFKAK